ncbi:MAG: ribosomal-protein-alanine N-acetyltransferase [Sneathiella sp.]|jgi:ribosomal-protein-alanine N-acetyltransferase
MSLDDLNVINRFLYFGAQKPVVSDRLYIRYPRLSDWQQWSAVRTISRDHLVPWEPVWSPNNLSKVNFKARLRHYARDAREDIGHAYFLFRKDNHHLIGSITLSNIRRGVSQTGSIGYWTGLPYIRKGYMFEALCALLPFIFEHHGLRRVEAACVPENAASGSLLRKVGFIEEGRAREYLCINGTWQDHLLFALLESDKINSTDTQA